MLSFPAGLADRPSCTDPKGGGLALPGDDHLLKINEAHFRPIPISLYTSYVINKGTPTPETGNIWGTVKDIRQGLVLIFEGPGRIRPPALNLTV